ncbi:MAG TPA: cysteine--tRNA ligase [Dehalococcoidia bacterium]
MRLTNTLTGTKEEFTPGGETVTMYVCGLTPYEEAHIGHAMSAIVFDVLRRYLEFRGHRVRHVQNFTDVDDRIIERARQRGVRPEDLAARYIDRYFEDLHALNVLPAHEYPFATREIPEMITIIQTLIDRGYAYVADNGDVYYRVRRKEDYGKLSHRSVDSLLAGARVEPGEVKEDPLDFALWKAAKPGEPQWDSPWGPGRPGWHIECTAMSLKYLGHPIDIHGGGMDLVFPHHENEIAQSEAYLGEASFVRYWVHNGWLTLGGEKMSKSLGNIISIREGLERYGADALRLFVLNSHYRSPLSYAEESLEAAVRGAERLRTAARTPGPAPEDGAPVDPAPFRARFVEAMEDDLNTPRALAALFDLATEINRGRDAGRPVESAQSALLELAGVLGLRLEEPAADLAAAPFIDLLVEVRSALRAARQYALADRVRDRLGELGVALEDTPQGTVWKRRA